MEVISNREEMIFVKEHEGRKFYKIGISKKDKEGNWVKGYIDCKFKKDVNLDNMTKIRINNAWIDFYLKDKQTIPFVFVNEFTSDENVALPEELPF